VASWGTPPVHVTGDTLAVSDWNTVANNETFLYEAPYGLYYNSSGTSCGSGGATQVTLGGTTASGYSFSVSSNNVIVPIAGIYTVLFLVMMASTAGSGGNYVQSQVQHNGSATLNGSTVPSYMAFPGSSGCGSVKCAASDTLGLYLVQTSGSSLTTLATAPQDFLHAFYVGST